MGCQHRATMPPCQTPINESLGNQSDRPPAEPEEVTGLRRVKVWYVRHLDHWLTNKGAARAQLQESRPTPGRGTRAPPWRHTWRFPVKREASAFLLRCFSGKSANFAAVRPAAKGKGNSRSAFCASCCFPADSWRASAKSSHKTHSVKNTGVGKICTCSEESNHVKTEKKQTKKIYASFTQT